MVRFGKVKILRNELEKNTINIMRAIFINQRTLHLYPAVNLNSNNLTKKCRGLSPEISTEIYTT